MKSLIIGINKYRSSPLRGCVNDAKDVSAIVDHGDVTLLLDGEATYNAICRESAKMCEYANGSTEPCLIWFSGHGMINASGESSWVPADYESSWVLTRRELGFDRITNLSNLVVVADCCYSGALTRSSRANTRPRSMNRGNSSTVKKDLSKPDMICYVGASKSDEVAMDASFDGRPNGAFTRQWLEAYKANTKRSMVQLLSDTKNRLMRLGYTQTPVISGQPYTWSVPFSRGL